jgi:hypothetical protein
MKVKEKLADSYVKSVVERGCRCDDCLRDWLGEYQTSDIQGAFLAGFEAAKDLAARKFEGHEQEFKTDNDSVEFTYRVMAIISEHIRSLGEEEAK